MISCLEWIPKGAADPQPKRYQMSKVELEMLEDQAQYEAELQQAANNENDDEENEDSDTEVESVTKPSNNIISNELPADLRMDEYSSDEDDDDGNNNNSKKNASRLGDLLVGHSSFHNEADEEDALEKVAQEMNSEDEKMSEDDKDEDSDSDSDDDDLADIQDTREYTSTDIEGLKAMGLAHPANTNDPTYYGDNKYGDEEYDLLSDGDDDNNSDIDDTNLTPHDALLCVAKTEEDFASLEIHLYEQNTGNVFVHHDIPLPSYPLTLAHGDISNEGTAGNFLAVGTFNPGIEIWNLDVLDALEPICILGGQDTSIADEIMKENMLRAVQQEKKKGNSNNKKKKGKKKKNKNATEENNNGGLKPESHTDAIMSLSWNKTHRQVLASGSADHTVKIWDITSQNNNNENESGGKPAYTFTHHTDKVNAVVWHPTEGTLLATGGYDQQVALVEVNTQQIKSCKIPSDCEALVWDPFETHLLVCACEDGTVICWDVREEFGSSATSKKWSFIAHEFGGISDLSFNQKVKGFMATCAVDKTVKLWDTLTTTGKGNNAPQLITQKEMNVGKLFSIQFYPSTPWLLGTAGSGNQLALWNLEEDSRVQKRFQDRVVEIEDEDNVQPQSQDEEGEDLEAVMSAKDTAMEKLREKEKAKNDKKKNNKKKKKKAHKKSN